MLSRPLLHALAAAIVAVLPVACHRDTTEPPLSAEPALAEVVNATALEIADTPPGDPTEGAQQEQLEYAEEVAAAAAAAVH